MELQHHALCYLTDSKRKKSGHPSAIYGSHNIVSEDARRDILAAYEGHVSGKEEAKKKEIQAKQAAKKQKQEEKQQQKSSNKRKASTSLRLSLPSLPVMTGKENTEEISVAVAVAAAAATHKSGDLQLVDDDALLVAALEAVERRLSQSQGIIPADEATTNGDSVKKQKLC